MAFHLTNLGKFGEQLRQHADALGFVPEEGDEGYTEEVGKATKRALAELEEWRKKNA